MTEVVVDDGQTYVSEETAIIATEAAAQAKQWAEESERQANISTNSADEAQIWAEGTDAQVEELGGIHSAKNWVDMIAQINVKSYGAKGDGITDDTAAIQAAVNANSYIYFPEGTYLINSQISCDKSLTIEGNGAVLKCGFADSSTNAIFHFPLKNAVTSTTATANITQQDTYITVSSTSGISIGDYLIIHSNEYWDGIEGVSGFGIETKGELNQVQYIDGNKIYLTIPAQDTYNNSSYPVTVDVYKYHEHISISGITFIGTGNGNTHTTDNPTGGRAITFNRCARISITNCKFVNFPRYAIQALHCFDMVVNSNIFVGVEPTDSSNSSDTRSIWFTGATFLGCANITFTGNTGLYLRRVIDTDSVTSGAVCRNITITGNSCSNCRQVIGTHGCDNITVSGNIGVGCDSGITVRGKNAVISNNSMTVSGTYGILIGAYLSGSNLQHYSDNPSAGRVVVSNNKSVGGQYGLWVSVDVDNIIINGNDFKDAEKFGIYMSGRRIYGAKITNNTITGAPSSTSSGEHYGVNITNLGTDYLLIANNIDISNNTINGYYRGIIIAGSAQTGKVENLSIRGNILANCTSQGVRLGNDGFSQTIGYFGSRSLISDNIINAPTPIQISTTQFDVQPVQADNVS